VRVIWGSPTASVEKTDNWTTPAGSYLLTVIKWNHQRGKTVFECFWELFSDIYKPKALVVFKTGRGVYEIRQYVVTKHYVKAITDYVH